MKEDSLLSKTIAWLRFPLIVLVVSIHVLPRFPDIKIFDFPIAFYVVEILRKEISSIAVPLFFVISGFLFFRGIEKFTREIYFKKLRSRVKSLLVPYLIWCLISFAISLIVLWNSGEFFALKILKRAILSFLACGHCCTQFWFVRELMVCILFSPLFYFFIRHWRWFCPLVFGIIACSFPPMAGPGFGYCFPGTELPMFLGSTSFFFFSIGATLAIEKIDFVIIAGKYAFPLGIIWAIVMIGELIQMKILGRWNPILHQFEICIGAAAVVGLVASGIAKGGVRECTFLSGATFFVFAAHNYFLVVFTKIYTLLILDNFGCGNVTIILAEYFGVLFAVLLCLAIWWILKKAFPRIAALLVGGR